MIKVIVKNPRPDFRVFVDLLFGFGRNIDSDGDSNPVYSRSWRELYISDRESDEPHVELYSELLDPLQFEVKSKSKRLEELAALYLYLSCGVSMEKDGVFFSEQDIQALKLNYVKEITRADNSIWHQSGEKNPYPNLG